MLQQSLLSCSGFLGSMQNIVNLQHMQSLTHDRAVTADKSGQGVSDSDDSMSSMIMHIT